MSVIESLNENDLRNVIHELEQRVAALELRTVQGVDAIDEISNNLGDQKAGSTGGWVLDEDTLGSPNGAVVLDSVNERIVLGSTYQVILDALNRIVKSGNYISGSSGWGIGGAGDAEFNNITARGAIKSAVFERNQVTATAGSILVTKSAGKLRAEAVSLASPGTFALDVDDPESGHAALFAAGDVLRLRAGGVDNWVQVSGVSDQVSFYRYTVVLVSGVAGAAFKPGAAVIDYGASGDGWLELTADQAGAPRYSVMVHGGSPWSNGREVLRLGRLQGVGSFGAGDFGLATIDATGAVQVYALNDGRLAAGAGDVMLDENGISIAARDFENNVLRWMAGSDRVSTFNVTKNVTDKLISLLINAEADYTGLENARVYIEALASHVAQSIMKSESINGVHTATLSTYADLTKTSIAMDASEGDEGGYLFDMLGAAITPAASQLNLYPKSNGEFYKKNPQGFEKRMLTSHDLLHTLYPVNVVSDVAQCYCLETTPVVSESSMVISASVSSSTGETLLYGFVTHALNRNFLDAGLWHNSIFARTTTDSGVNNIVVRMYLRTAAGDETEIYSGTTGALTTTTSEYPIDVWVGKQFINLTDRLVVRFYGISTSATAVSLQVMYQDDTRYTCIHTPIGTFGYNLGGAYLYRNSTQSLASGGTFLSWNSEIYNIDSAYWSSAKPTRLVAPSDGYYELGGGILSNTVGIYLYGFAYQYNAAGTVICRHVFHSHVGHASFYTGFSFSTMPIFMRKDEYCEIFLAASANHASQAASASVPYRNYGYIWRVK